MPNAAIITLVALAAAGCAVLATLLILRRRRFDVITAPADGNLQPKAPLGMTGMVSEVETIARTRRRLPGLGLAGNQRR